ncbi:hypothetical protein A2U01_0007277, partial [Trifolium medium]|nr:hypothetical protein [Trifolium medium]
VMRSCNCFGVILGLRKFLFVIVLTGMSGDGGDLYLFGMEDLLRECFFYLKNVSLRSNVAERWTRRGIHSDRCLFFRGGCSPIGFRRRTTCSQEEFCSLISDCALIDMVCKVRYQLMRTLMLYNFAGYRGIYLVEHWHNDQTPCSANFHDLLQL